jgi:hypothetical protein
MIGGKVGKRAWAYIVKSPCLVALVGVHAITPASATAAALAAGKAPLSLPLNGGRPVTFTTSEGTDMSLDLYDP